MNETYRALRLERFAPNFREAVDVVALPMPLPGPGEIRVRNYFCGINGIFDTQLARNAIDYIKINLPTFTGVEALGIVDALGEGVKTLSLGDPVVCSRFTGGYREINCGPEEQFVRVPDVRPEWLALASTGVSALLALDRVAELKEGETIAISAAAGGMGHLLVQLALIRGCHVIGIAGGPQKCAFVSSLGAQRVIDYKSEDLAAVLAIEYPRGVDVAFDTIGGAVFDAFLANLAQHGRLVISGAASDNSGKPELLTAPRIYHALYYKGASVRAFMNGLFTQHWGDARERLFALFAADKLQVHFDQPHHVGLAGIYDAVERLLSGQSMGKVIARFDHS